MKRKDFQEIEEDFSSPFNARPAKSRRLDGELLQCLEENPRFQGEEVMGEYLELEPQNAVDEVLQTAASVTGETMPLVDSLGEKAIVLYQPPPVPRSPSSPEFSIVLDSNLIPGLRDRIWWLGNQKQDKSVDEKLAAGKSMSRSDNSLAVIPWVAPEPLMNNVADGQATDWSDAMDAEDTDMMDADESPASDSGGTTERMEPQPQLQWQPQQQQQWMMLPGVLQNIHTPIPW